MKPAPGVQVHKAADQGLRRREEEVLLLPATADTGEETKEGEILLRSPF